LTAGDLGGVKSLVTVTDEDMLMTAFEHMAQPVYGGAIAVVSSKTSELVWYISSDTLKLAGETGQQLGLSLSKTVGDFYSRLKTDVAGAPARLILQHGSNAKTHPKAPMFRARCSSVVVHVNSQN
jgi:hypothetical protein